MTFEYRDPDGDRLAVLPAQHEDYCKHGPAVAFDVLMAEETAIVHVPLDHVEEVAAGLRDAARQAAGQPAAEPDPTTADEPVPLRWGLNDVLYGDDDTVTVCFSGPDREPYWLELTPDQATVLRDDLAGPDREEPQDHPGAELYAQLRKAGNDHETTNRLIYAHAAMVIRQHQALNGDSAPAVGLAAPTNHTTEQQALDELLSAFAGRQYGKTEAIRLAAAYRAAILNSAAEALDADMERFFAEWPDEPRNSPYANGRKDAANDLRRLAAGAES